VNQGVVRGNWVVLWKAKKEALRLTVKVNSRVLMRVSAVVYYAECAPAHDFSAEVDPKHRAVLVFDTIVFSSEHETKAGEASSYSFV